MTMGAQSRFTVSRRGFLGGAAALAGLIGLSACSGIQPDRAASTGTHDATPNPEDETSAEMHPSAPATPATPAEVAARAVVPVLCYHQVRDYTAEDSEYTRTFLVIEPSRFTEHLDAISNAGYKPISAEQYYQHLTAGAQLPEKPVLLTFDDGKDNQYSNAYRMLSERGWPGMLYIMTVVIGQDGWVTKQQVKEMADAGFGIGSHTWDHHRVDEYSEEDLTQQLVGSRETLETITGKQIEDFAYPYGAWNEKGAALVEKAGYRVGYQLMDKPLSKDNPLYSLRREMVASNLTGAELVTHLDTFASSTQDSGYAG